MNKLVEYVEHYDGDTVLVTEMQGLASHALTCESSVPYNFNIIQYPVHLVNIDFYFSASCYSVIHV